MLQVNNVHYSYKAKYQKVEALCGVSCTFYEGKFYSITGIPGSGKSTLLSLLSGLFVPTKGSIQIDGTDLSKINRNKYRRNKVAMIYESQNLFPLLTVLENIMFPLQMDNAAMTEASKKAHELLEQIGLPESYATKLPDQLTGSEQLKVAIARALAMPGRFILADEPCGNLSAADKENLVNLLSDLAHKNGYCVVMVTQDIEITKRSDEVYELQNGEIIIPQSQESIMNTDWLYSRMK